MGQHIQLGKYRLFHHLATGGMGEVFLARQEGPAGFSKTVVVKRILPSVASDEMFVSMFLDEARLAAMLEHPPVVQIFDLGLEDGTYFIAMEYIHGLSLRAIRQRLVHRSRSFPPELLARVCSQALQGLHYAHTLSDEAGTPLQIVHRDVSPDNLLIGFNGVTKVVDFGIAKAAVNVSTTRAGMVRGKFAYMAPEQLTGKPMDARTDIYAMGVLLYELLTGQRPFHANSEPGLIRAILQDQVSPPRESNPAVPAALEAVVMRAMTRHPEHRFESAEQMSLALETYIQSTGKTVTNAHIGALVRELFPEQANKLPGTGITPAQRPVSFGLTPAPGSVPSLPSLSTRSSAGVVAPPVPSSGIVSVPSGAIAPMPSASETIVMPPEELAASAAVRSREEAALPDIEIVEDDPHPRPSSRRQAGLMAALFGAAAVLAGAAVVMVPREPPAVQEVLSGAQPALLPGPAPAVAEVAPKSEPLAVERESE